MTLFDDTVPILGWTERARHTPPDLQAKRTGKVRRDHPDTSHDAARAVKPRSGTQRAAVYAAIAAHGGLTDEGIAEVTGLSPNSVRPRRVELVERSQVVDSGRRATTASGRKAIVWMVEATRRRGAL